MKKLLRITTVPISLDKLLGEQLRFMDQYFDLTAISADPEELRRVAEKYGVKHHNVEMTRTIAPLKDLAAVWKLYRFIKKEKPDIVHTHTPKAGIVGMLASWLARVPLRLHTVAGMPLMEAQGTKRKILDLVEKMTYAAATKVYPNSKGLYDFILRHQYTTPEKLKVIAKGSSNGINTDYFHKDNFTVESTDAIKKHLKIEEGDIVFIFVGRLVSDKGINELVAAFRSVQKEWSHVKLLLVGPLETELDPLEDSTLLEIKNNPAIISPGFKNDVRPYFALADALVFPSYREGFPNVVMQAGAMGLPSIVTDINGCNEIIEHEVNGLIIPVKDTEALRLAILGLLQDNELWVNLKTNSRRMIKERYEQKIVWDALLHEYKSLNTSAV